MMLGMGGAMQGRQGGGAGSPERMKAGYMEACVQLFMCVSANLPPRTSPAGHVSVLQGGNRTR